jgi:hypothetical protein
MPNVGYTEEVHSEALMMLALCRGNAEEAHRRLKERGNRTPDASTLSRWKIRDAERYEEIRTEISHKLVGEVANQAEQIMLEAGELELEIIARMRDELANLKPSDLSSALRNLSTTKALNNDKIASPIRGRPTVIHSDRTADEILRALKHLEPGLIVDGTAEESPSALGPGEGLP